MINAWDRIQDKGVPVSDAKESVWRQAGWYLRFKQTY